MHDILILKTVDSTNRVAREMADSGKPHGFAVLAENQTAGRGRLGKTWLSPPGKGLYCTIVVRPELDILEYSKITLTAGLAVSLILEEFCRLDVQLKWPNDIYIAGRKCGGILVETSSLQNNSDACFALVGIGLNVNGMIDEFPEELGKTATSLFAESAQEYDIFSLFSAIRDRILLLLSQLVAEGFGEILEQWQRRDMLRGKWMSWVTPAGKVVYGKSLGVDNNGVLLIQDSSGTRHEVLSGDLSLAARPPERGEKKTEKTESSNT